MFSDYFSFIKMDKGKKLLVKLRNTLRESTINKVKDRFIINREQLKLNGGVVYIISPKEKIEIPDQEYYINHSDFEKIIKRYENNHTLNNGFITEIHNGRILNDTRLCTTKEFDIILDSQKSWSNVTKRRFTIGNILKRKYSRHYRYQFNSDIDKASSLCPIIKPNNPNTNNYYVWVLNYLTKLQAIEYYITNIDQDLDLIIPKKAPSYVLDSLEFFGFKDNIYRWNTQTDLHIERLIVPSNRSVEVLGNTNEYNSKIVSPLACNWLRDKAKNTANRKKKKFSSKIIISREDSDRRKINNKSEVYDILTSNGFEPYKLSEMAFEDQVRLFQNANIIFGVHGAGLTNMIFSEDVKVIEVFGDIFKPTYYILSNLMGHDYHAVSGESIQNPSEKLIHQNINIDNNAMAKIVDLL